MFFWHQKLVTGAYLSIAVMYVCMYVCALLIIRLRKATLRPSDNMYGFYSQQLVHISGT